LSQITSIALLLTKYSGVYINEMDRALTGIGERRSAYRVLVGKPEGKRPLGILRLRFENDIKMNLHELGWRTWT
jgi:hypothetical protein